MQITWSAFKPRRKTFPEDENRTVNVWLAKQEQEGTACWPVDHQELLLTAKAMKLSFPLNTQPDYKERKGTDYELARL